MLRQIGLWLLAVLITVSAAVYQRMTGPTNPLRGTFAIGSETYKYRLPRSHGGEGDQKVSLRAPATIQAEMVWRPFPSDRQWNRITMTGDGDTLVAFLPHQPPAGKLEYYLVLTTEQGTVRIPPQNTRAVIRFKGAVPSVALIPHIFFMFAAMLVSNRAGLEALCKGSEMRVLTHITMVTLLLGGLIFGPIIQYYAFGQFWTGFPIGHDLTDNKVVIAVIGWLLPYFRPSKDLRNRKLVLIASLIMFIIYLIPHSVFGSELKWD